MGKKKIGRKVTAAMIAAMLAVPSGTALAQNPTQIRVESTDIGARAMVQPNIALGHPAYASSIQDGDKTADKAFDGESSTRWASGNEQNAWLYVDLGKNYQVDKLLLEFETLSTKYEIQVAEDTGLENGVQPGADAWQTVVVREVEKGYPGFGERYEDEIQLEEPVTARYVKFQGVQTFYETDKGQFWQWGHTLYEMKVYEEPWSDERIIDEYLKTLEVRTDVYHDFTLPVYDEENGIELSWESDSDALTIDEKGNVEVVLSEKAQKVNLTVKAKKGETVREKDFELNLASNIALNAGIYPIPHAMTKEDGSVDVTEEVNVITDGSIGEYVLQYAMKVLEESGLKVSKSEELSADSLNLVLGTKNDTGVDEELLPEGTYDPEQSLEQTDGYVFDVQEDAKAITILSGSDSGVHTGLATLEQVLDEGEKEISAMRIQDFADVPFRGVVEGFYGEWSHENRKDILDFMGSVKMNTYIYGAKGDEYHTSKWRELYPDEQAGQLGELVQKGKENNVEVVWAAHVGGNIDLGSEEDYQALINKFDQLYSLGVRQFGIFFDDAATDNTHLVEFINRVNEEYVHKKEGVKNLIVCPQYYSKNHGGQSYLRDIANFDKDVQIMWTGNGVISVVDNDMLHYIEDLIERPAFIWWNYPVNDLGMRNQLLIGETIGLDPEVKNISGLTSNPMLEAQSSKISLFSIADYLWNIATFDSHTSWEEAVDQFCNNDTVAEALKLFAVNCSKTYQELKDYGDESAYLADDIAKIENEFAGNKEYLDSAKVLLEEFEKIDTATETLANWQGNQGFLNEISSWISAARNVCDAGEDALKALCLLSEEELSQEQIGQVYTYYENAKKLADAFGGEKNFGSWRLRPFILNCLDQIKLELTRIFGMQPKQTAIASFDTDFSAMLDGSKVTEVSANSLKADDYFGVDLTQVEEIQDIHIFFGETKVSGVLEYSDDAQNWKTIQENEGNDVELTNLGLKGKYVRYRLTEVPSETLLIQEFRVNAAAPKIESNMQVSQDLRILEEGSGFSLVGLEKITLNPGEYVGIQMPKLKAFCNIIADQSLYENEGLSFAYSEDAKEWIEIDENITNMVNVKYLRITNISEDPITLDFDSITVSGTMSPKEVSVSMSSNLSIWEGSAENLIDKNEDNYIWTKDQQEGQYYEFQFGEETLLSDVRIIMKSGDIMEKGAVEILKDGEWEEVASFQGSAVTDVEIPLCTTSGVRVVVKSNSSTWLKINEIEFNKKSSASNVLLVDEVYEDVNDEDIVTAWQGTLGEGEMIYRNINTPDANALYIAKNAESVIAVEGKFGDNWIALGEYKDVFCEIPFESYGMASEFRITWKDGAGLKIYEVMPKENQEIEEPSETLSTAVLEYALELADKASTEGVISSVVERFEAAKTNGQAILDKVKAGDTTVSQADVDASWRELITAMQYLSFKMGDKTDLEKVVALAKTMEENIGLYVEETTGAFLKALVKAEETLADGDAMQEDIDTDWQALLTAMAGLRLKADKDLLKNLVSEAEGIELAQYTEESVQVFKAALASAKSVLEDNSLSEEDQATVDQAVEQLTSAKQGLEKIQASVDDATNEQCNSAAAGQDGNSAGTGTASTTAKSAKTGDMGQTAVIWMLLLMAAGSACVIVRRKMK